MRTRPQVTTGDCDYCDHQGVPVAHLAGPRSVTHACRDCLELALEVVIAAQPRSYKRFRHLRGSCPS